MQDASIEVGADGSGLVRLDARSLPARGTDEVAHAVRVSLESGLHRAVHERLWQSEGGRLLPVGP